MEKKCHNCDGRGVVRPKGSERTGECYYCRGKGYRNKLRGRDD